MSQSFSYRMAKNPRPLLTSSTSKCCTGFLSRGAESVREGVWGGKDWFQGMSSKSLLDNRQVPEVSFHVPHGDTSACKDAVFTYSYPAADNRLGAMEHWEGVVILHP